MKSARPIRRRKPSPPPGAWSVVAIDSAPIRREARRAYEKVLRELDTAKAEVERFESEDKPRYAKWLSANFGALLTEMRELQEKLFVAQGLVNEVQQEFYYGNYRSIGSAYKKVMRRRTQPEGEEIDPGKESPEEEEFRRGFEELFGQNEEEFWQNLGINPEELGQANTAPKREGGRLKDLYRRLVRRLHPDKGARRSAREIEWWHQTQEAYAAGDVEQLEMILTLVEIEDQGSKEASVSVLAQLTVEFKKSLRSMKRKISSFKRDIAWNFSRLTDFNSLFEKTRQQLRADRDEILWLLQKYERQIQSWELAAAGSRKRVRSRRTALQDEEWF